MHNQFVRRSSSFIFLFTAILLFFINEKGKAQVLWSSSGGSAWLTGGNWTGSAVPTTSQIAQFGANPTGSGGVGINYANATNNGTQNQACGAVDLTSARSSGNMLVGNSSSTSGKTGILTLNGTTVNSQSNVVIRNNSSQNLTLQDIQGSGTQTMGVAFGNATNNAIYLDGSGNITLSSILSSVSGTTPVAISGSSTSGTVNITGTANTFTGDITLTGPETVFSANGSFGNSANNINIDGGRLTFGTSFTLASARSIKVGATSGTSISVTGSLTGTYTGIISNYNSATGAWAKQGTGTLVLGGVSTYTGATSINNGTIQLSTGSNRLPTGTVLSIGASGKTCSFDLNGKSQQLAGLNSVAATANTVTSTAAATLTIGGSGTYSFGSNSGSNPGIISGAISLVINGSSSSLIQSLGDVNTFTGSVTLTNGTLQAANSGNIIPNTTPIIFNGGKWSTNTYTETMGTISLTDNSIIALGSGGLSLIFSDSHTNGTPVSGVTWTSGKVLTITGWVSTAGSSAGSSNPRLYIGTTTAGLSSTQLAQITFSGYAAGATILSDGEIVPTTSSCTTPGTPSCSTPSAVCYPATATITGTGSSPAATTYTYWTGASGGSAITSGTTPAGTVSGNNLTTIASTAAGTYTYYVQGENGACVSASRQAVTVTINGVPTQPSFTTASSTNNVVSPCATATGLTYTIAAISGVTYAWTVPSGWVINSGQGTVSINVNASATSGNVSVTVTNGCGSNSNSIAATPVNGVPAQPGTISGTNPVCQSASAVAYSISMVSTATSYTWGFTGSGGTNSSTTNTASYSFSSSATSGTLSVVANNVCGASASGTLALTVNNTPSFSTQPTSVNIAPGASTSFTAAASNSPSYQWQYSSNGSSGWGNVANSAPSGVTYTNGNTATMNVATTTSTPVNVYYYQVIATANGCSATSSSATMGLANYVSFDDFSRTNNNTVGIPSSVLGAGGTTTWTENETSSAAARISIESQMLRLSSSSTPTSGGNNSNGHEFLTFDVSSNYTTTFSNATNNLEWYFNIHSSRSSPSGFSTSNTYATALVLGSDNSDFYSSGSAANGYAVIIGNSSSPDPVKLVSFAGGLNANSNVTDVATSTETGETDYYSVHVTFNSCTNQWALQVRSDGASAFASPTSGSYGTAVTATNSTHVSKNLKYFGAYWQHGSPASGSEDAWFDNLYIPTNVAQTTTYTWNGTSTDYQVSTAWTPSRTCPRVTDILQFNSATSPSTCTVTNIPTQTIGQLIVSGSRTVTLSDALSDAAASTINIGGNSSDDLQVGAGSTLNFDVATSNNAADALVIQLATGVTASISGNVVFKNSNSGTAARPHQLLGTDASSINFNSGAIFTAQDLSGDPFGSTGTAGTVIFKSGSKFISQDGSAPFGLTQPSSKVVFNSGSLYRHEQSTAPSFTGRTYANFEFNYSGTINCGVGSSSSSYCTIDTFAVTQGTVNFPLTTNNLPLHFNIKGDIKFNGGTFNFSPTSTTADFKIGGTVLQNLTSGSGTFTFGSNSTIEMNNTAGLQLSRDLITTGSLTLTNGKIATGAYEVFVNNSSTSAVSGYSALHSSTGSSYINGSLRRKVTTGVYDFPVGTSSNYEISKITVNSNSNVDNLLASFTAFGGGCAYADNLPNFGVTPTGANTSAVTDMLNYGYYIVEPYDASKTLVSSPTINYDAEMTFNGHTNGVTISNLVPKCYTLIKRSSSCSGAWGIGSGSLVNTTQQGSAGATNVITAKLSGLGSFSQFGMGFSGTQILPISLLSFDVVLKENTVMLNWITASEQSNNYFAIQKSSDGISFNTINTIAGQGTKTTQTEYEAKDILIDNNAATIYYRLKQVDYNGGFSFSAIKAVSLKPAGVLMNFENAYPNPFTSVIQLTIASEINEAAQFTLINTLGKVVLQKQIHLNKGSNAIATDDLSYLPNGVYWLTIKNNKTVIKATVQKL